MIEAAARRPLIGITVNRDYRRERFWLPTPYCLRVERAGGLPLLLPPLQPSSAGLLLDSLGGLLLGGGGDIAPIHCGESPGPGLGEVDPERDAWELVLFRGALGRGLPVLGICRGLQLINVALGGNLIRDLAGPGFLQHRQGAPRHHPTHTVEILPRTRLASFLGEGHVAVNSFHHQAPARVAPGLRTAALAPDGIIEALEDPDRRFLLGVQWHPESLDHPATESLFRAFTGAARRPPEK